MMLTAIYHMVSQHEMYDATHYDKLQTIPKTRELSLAQAMELVKKHGYTVAEPVPA